MAGPFDAVWSAFGEQVFQVWSPDRGEPNATAGVDNPAWRQVGTDVPGVREAVRMENAALAAGNVAVGASRLYMYWADGVLLRVDDLVVDADSQVWRVSLEPIRHGNPLPHAEILIESVGTPPLEVLP